MLQKLWTYLRQGYRYAGLEITEIQGQTNYSLLVCRQQKGELLVQQRLHSASLQELAKDLPKNIPLVVSVNTQKVLTKLAERGSKATMEARVNQAYPNLNFDNFYYEVIQKEHKPLIAVCQRSHLDEIESALAKEGLNPVCLRIGISAMSSLLGYLESDLICTSNFELRIKNNLIDRLSPLKELSEAPIQAIGGLSLKNTDLLPFAGILAFLGTDASEGNLHSKNSFFKKEYEDKRLFQLGLRTALVLVLSLLLVNFLAFDHYYSNTESLAESVETNNASINRLKSLEASVLKKEERLRLIQASGNSKVTYFLDRLGATLPSGIQLEELTYQPLQKPLRASQAILLEEGQLLVRGICSDTDKFSRWMIALEEMHWIGTVEVMDYDLVGGKTSRFALKVKIDEQ